MRVLAGLKPEKVLYYFEEITRIPHGSGNIEKISNYIAQFAKDRNLFCIQDEVGNIIIRKAASKGYENEPTVILQGHMDMVAVCTPQSNKDMQNEGLEIGIDGDEIYAKDTSLGGDDGIAVAYSLAILDDANLVHPELEVIITVDEEVGMDGARVIDLSCLHGHRMINLDSEEEGYFLTSCAGGARTTCHLPVEYCKTQGIKLTVRITGLLGGHSGEEIIKGRANSNCLFARILKAICKNSNARLCSVKGGLADNAIPRETGFSFVVDTSEVNVVKDIIFKQYEAIKDEFSTKDSNILVDIVNEEEGEFDTVCNKDTLKVANYILSLPDGIISLSGDVEGLVETSLNMGILNLNAKEVVAEFAVRSSVGSSKDALIEKIISISQLAGATVTVTGEYPGWKYRVNSPLRDKMVKVYKEVYGKEPILLAIHAGLECGLLGDKISDLDCVSIGPDMKNIHTTDETLSISSTARVWDFLVKLLAQKDVVK